MRGIRSVVPTNRLSLLHCGYLFGVVGAASEAGGYGEAASCPDVRLRWPRRLRWPCCCIAFAGTRSPHIG